MQALFHSMSAANVVELMVIVALVVDRFHDRKSKRRKDELETENAALSLLQKQANTFRDELEKVKTEVIRLNTVILEKDKQLEMFERIFQNRNPESEKFMTSMLQAAHEQSDYRKQTTEVFGKLLVYMEGVNKHLELEVPAFEQRNTDASVSAPKKSN